MNLSLRQKKYYKTRLALAQLFLEKLKIENFNDISIKEICSEVEISEATFFNYFPQKTDIIMYLFKVKFFKIFWIINDLEKSLSFTGSIEKIFELFAHEIKHPYIFEVIISIFRTSEIKMDSINISEREWKYIYPSCTGAEKIVLPTIYEYLEGKISKGIKDGEIPEDICKKTLLQFLITILKGVPLSTPIAEFKNIAKIYKKHLSLLWRILQQ